MSTRSVIARPRGHGIPPRDAQPIGFFAKILGRKPRPQYEGVYHHNGGRPDEMGPVLFHLYHARYKGDLTRFHKEMIDDNPAGWSSIHCFGPGSALAERWDGRTKLTVEEGFAYFQRDEPEPGPRSFQGDPRRQVPGISGPPIRENSDHWGADYVYVLDAPGLVILELGDQGFREIARVPWSQQDIDWEFSSGDDDE